MSYFIGIDLGGTVIKAGIYDECGNEVSVCRAQCHTDCTA